MVPTSLSLHFSTARSARRGSCVAARAFSWHDFYMLLQAKDPEGLCWRCPCDSVEQHAPVA
eukprot:1577187-Amphidinium_carterae.1